MHSDLEFTRPRRNAQLYQAVWPELSFWPSGGPFLIGPAGDDARQGYPERFDLLAAGRAADRDAQSAKAVAMPHRLQHVAWPDLSRRAGGAGRQRDTRKIEGDLGRLGLDAGNSEECRVGKP